MAIRKIFFELMYKGQIYMKWIKKDSALVSYLNYLVEKGVLKFNEEHQFFVYDYEKHIDPLNCPYIKLKYFYNWKFPPQYKDEDIPEMEVTPLLKSMFDNDNINIEVFPEEKKEYLRLCKVGFIIRDPEGYLYFVEFDKIKKILLEKKAGNKH